VPDLISAAEPASTQTRCELTILMPCLNEAETLATCIKKAQGFIARAGIDGEVLIADNGSTDGSQDIARKHGARVVDVPIKGYGAALIAGTQAARGAYVVMGDSDDSYDFSRLDAFLEKLREGYDLVMGNRFKGGIAPGAMPPLHKYLGNPVLTTIGRILFRSKSGDFHCGMRGYRRDAIIGLDLQTTGMEFASEMVVRATIHKLRMTEVPTTLSPDGRSRPPHLRSWRDGWRHLRFLLLFSPRWLFLFPGIVLFLIGLAGMFWLLPQPRHVGGVVLDVHTLLYSSVAMVVGFQSALFWVFAKVFAIREGLLPFDPGFKAAIETVTLEVSLVISALLIALGIGIGLYALSSWGAAGFGPLSTSATMRWIIPSATAISIGFQLLYGSFFISVLGIRTRRASG
jgi:glycosyltransferase involved in cell wall biosynthesis